MQSVGGQSIVAQILKEEIFSKSNEFTQDPNALFTEDDPKEALKKLTNLNFLREVEKLNYMKNLTDLIELNDQEGIKAIPVLLDYMVKESKIVKLEFIKHVSNLTRLMIEKKAVENIKDQLIPKLFILLNSEDLEVKENVGKEIVQITKMVVDKEITDSVLQKILAMAHDDNVEESRIVSVQLLSQLAPLFGKTVCEQYIAHEFLALGQDPQIRVRKEIVSNMMRLSSVVSHDFFVHKLFHMFINLSQDNIWVVRKACVDYIVEISQLSEPKVRESILTPIFVRFFTDINKWVKISAYKNLGPFISTLAGLNISESLLKHYYEMIESSVINLSGNNELLVCCAYNFPAILQSFGANRWPELQKLFYILTKKAVEVKKPLACALHELAKVIGPERAEVDLIPVLDSFLNDSSEVVRLSAIKNLASFIKVFDEDKKLEFIELIYNLQRDAKKWRIRDLFAEQIEKLARLYDRETVFRIICPISLKLCSDSVSIVREKAAKKIYTIMARFQEEDCDPLYAEFLIQSMNGFSHSIHFSQRQTFVLMCEELLNFQDLMKKHFLESLLRLQKDRVSNVRMTLTRVVGTFILRRGFKCDSVYIELIEGMLEDKYKDIKQLALDVVRKHPSYKYLKYSLSPSRADSLEKTEALVNSTNQPLEANLVAPTPDNSEQGSPDSSKQGVPLEVAPLKANDGPTLTHEKIENRENPEPALEFSRENEKSPEKLASPGQLDISPEDGGSKNGTPGESPEKNALFQTSNQSAFNHSGNSPNNVVDFELITEKDKQLYNSFEENDPTTENTTHNETSGSDAYEEEPLIENLELKNETNVDKYDRTEDENVVNEELNQHDSKLDQNDRATDHSPAKTEGQNEAEIASNIFHKDLEGVKSFEGESEVKDSRNEQKGEEKIMCDSEEKGNTEEKTGEKIKETEKSVKNMEQASSLLEESNKPEVHNEMPGENNKSEEHNKKSEKHNENPEEHKENPEEHNLKPEEHNQKPEDHKMGKEIENNDEDEGATSGKLNKIIESPKNKSEADSAEENLSENGSINTPEKEKNSVFE